METVKNGKGSRNRSGTKKYRDNWEEIFNQKEKIVALFPTELDYPTENELKIVGDAFQKYKDPE